MFLAIFFGVLLALLVYKYFVYFLAVGILIALVGGLILGAILLYSFDPEYFYGAMWLIFTPISIYLFHKYLIKGVYK
jgi:hypothetical protein